MVTTQRQQLLFQGCYFFRADAFFQDLRFLKTVPSLKQLFFPEYLLFWSKTSTQQPLLENMKLFRAITFRNSYIFGGAIVQNKDIYRRASFLKQVFPHTISFFRRGKFSKSQFFRKEIFRITYFYQRATFLEWLLVKKTLPIALFRGASTFQKTSSPQLHLLFISQELSELNISYIHFNCGSSRGGCSTAETSKMKRFVIIVNGFKPLTNITKRSILDVVAVLDPPLSSSLRIYYY